MRLEQNRDAGIYCRLSNDDERTGESVSIENQKLLLRKYVKEQGWNEVDIYIDDGYSGTNFDRPAVQRMIEDVKAKRINIVVVKDLSRFGRNYIEIGQYTDYLFPQVGCRFIALNNGVDTISQSSSNDMMGFLNLFNEFYSRDTSKKVKAAKKVCYENGKFMGTYAPYGYKRDPQNKHRLIIDEDYAPIVRRIFDLRCSGMGYRSIAILLNEEGILPPGVLYYHRKGQADPRNVNQKWADSTVSSLLRNEVYIGHMVQGKSGTLSYKCKNLVSKPKDEWIKVENTHEAIVTPEVFATAAALKRERYQKREVVDTKPSVFTGLMYCADCGFKMGLQRERGKRKDGSTYSYDSFVCGNYRRSGKTACTTHSIYENVLMPLVIADIREKAMMVKHDNKRIAEKIIKQKNAEESSRLSGYERELRAAQLRIPEIERMMMNLYEDRIKGSIPETVFAMMMKKYETDQAELTAAIPVLEDKIKHGRTTLDGTALWMKHIKEYTEIETVDEATLIELVERIEVSEPRKIDGVRVCDIRIVYRYVGCVDEAMTGVPYAEAV